MFSFFRKSAKDSKNDPKEDISSTLTQSAPTIDTALIAVISAAIARFREADESHSHGTGFIVRRVRRI